MVGTYRTAAEEAALERLREADRKRRDEAAAGKIAAFLTARFGKGAVMSSCESNDHTKIHLVDTYPGCIKAHHRGYEIFADCSGAPDAEKQFRDWCAEEFRHARVFPRRSSPKQSH